MKKVLISFGVIFLLIALEGFGLFLHGQKQVSLMWPPLEVEGFSTWPTPRTFDGPGTILRVIDDRLVFVRDLNLTVQNVGTEAFPDIRETNKWTVGILASFMGLTGLNVSSSKKFSVDIMLHNPQRFRVSEAAINTALEATDIDLSGDGIVFIVCEAIAVDGIDLVANTEITLSPEVNVDEVDNIKVSAEADTTGETSTSLSQEFSEPHYMFYIATQVGQLRGLEEPQTILLNDVRLEQWRTEVR